MTDPTRPTLQLGIHVDPSAQDPREPFRRAHLAEEGELDLIVLMDHPYNRRLFDTWTLLTALATETSRVHVGTDVLNTPLRPPAMMAKMAATLDILSGGRLVLGLGAGGYWRGIQAYGVEKRDPGEAYAAFEEYLEIVRGMWEHAGETFRYEGDYYQVPGARPGPAPSQRIPIWTGAYGPKMLRLTGRQADGVFVSKTYLPPEGLARFHRRIDEGAEEAGRPPSAIRRGYNLMGVLEIEGQDVDPDDLQEGAIRGPVETWVETIAGFYRDDRMDTFIFWPVAGDERAQIEVFAREVSPAVRRRIEAQQDDQSG